MFKKITTLIVALFFSLSIFAIPSKAGAAPTHKNTPTHQLVQKTHQLHRKALITPLQRVQWSWVGWCETHDNWTMEGSLYAGALGITRTNWVAYGGLRFAKDAAHASPDEQMYIAALINKGYPVPDQPTGKYCNPLGW